MFAASAGRVGFLKYKLQDTWGWYKRVLLIAGKVTWTAKDWAVALIDGLQRCDWGILRGIISD